MIKKSTAIKFLILVIITIGTLIILDFNSNFKPTFYKYVYDDNLSFATVNSWYQSKFGNPLPFDNLFENPMPVFEEKLEYSEANKYKDGVSLNVGIDYLVPTLEDGIVIFIGEKEGYGKTVIIQQSDGIDVWYSNLKEVNVNLYDYIKKGSLVGNVSEKLYLVFIKDGEVIEYQEYI